MKNSLLIDTHIFLWLVLKIRLSPTTIGKINDVGNLYMSSISFLEIMIKQNNGKLPQFDIVELVNDMRITVLPYTENHAIHHRNYSPTNKDPFDNVIVTVAITEKLTLMTADKNILGLDIP